MRLSMNLSLPYFLKVSGGVILQRAHAAGMSRYIP